MLDTRDRLAAMQKLLDDIEHKVRVKVIKLQYANAKDVENQLRSKLDAKSVGSVLADERSNQVIISAYPGRMKEILPIVKSLDAKTKAVVIDVRILQITINPKFDRGIDWERSFSRVDKQALRTLNFRGAFPISSTVSTDSSVGTVGKIGWGSLTADQWEIKLKSLKQVERTNLLASPRMMILNRQEAKINIGDRIPYVVTTTSGTGANASVSEEIKFVDVGLIVVVTPVINDDGFITMKIRPEVSSKTSSITTPTKNEIPLVNTTFLETSVVVKDGFTVIIGGLRRDEMTENSKGLPYLMDIPFLGNLFKSRAESTRKTEIVMFITPKITTGAKSNAWPDPEIKPFKDETILLGEERS